MKALIIARTNLLRFLRDRSTAFVVFIFPFVVVLVIGLQLGGETEPLLGIHAPNQGELTTDLIARLDAVDGMAVEEFNSRSSAVTGVERGEVLAALIVPEGWDAAVRRGEALELEFISRSGEEPRGMRNNVAAVTGEQSSLIRAALFAEVEGAGTFDEGFQTATAFQPTLGDVSVVVSEAGEAFNWTTGPYDSATHSQLLLFMFVTSLAGAATLIKTRQLGVARRMMASPTPTRTVLLGEGLGRYAIALTQGLIIVVGSSLLFQVDWGDPLGAAAITLVFALVGSGAALLLGALARNDEQAGSLGVLIGLGFAALGGAMYPLFAFEIVAPGLYRAAHVTPHAWGIEAFYKLLLEDGGLIDILPYLGILLAYAAVFYALAVWRLRTVLTR
jgi:ABC-2 type transport system permease protein